MKYLTLFSIFLLSFIPVFAQETEPAPEGVDTSELTLVADVNIYNAEVTYFNGVENTYTIDFDIVNKFNYQDDVRYSVVLVDTETGVLADRHLFDDVVALNKGERVAKEVMYTPPTYLVGEYEIWMIADNSSGLRFSQVPVQTIVLSGTGEYVSIDLESCVLVYDGETYNLYQGIDIESTDEVVLSCDVTNEMGVDQVLTAHLQTHRRTVSGPIVHEAVGANTYVVSAGETATLDVPLVLPEEPQAYDTVVTLRNDNGETVSNEIIPHYVIRGASATIQNVTPDKESYEKGEMASVEVFFSPAADNFPDALGTSTELSNVTLTIQLTDDEGRVCADEQTVSVDPFEDQTGTYEFEVTRDCVGPTITASIADDSGVLDTKEVNVEVGEEEGGFMATIVIVIVVLVVLLLIGYSLKKNDQVVS